jgi:Uncharacterized protein conserved in bacteria
MKYKFFITSLITFIFFVATGQNKKFIYYFDADFNSVAKAKSIFTGTGTVENGIVKLICIANANNQVAMIGYFTDSSLKVHQGLSQFYFANGNKASESNYEQGKENGAFKSWDESGHLIDSTIYNNGEKITAATFYYDRKGRLLSYDLKDIKNDKEQKINYNDSGNVVSEINFKGKTGIVKKYDKGNIILDTVYSNEEREASFPGGDAAWSHFIKKQIEQHIDELVRDNQSGTCRLRFIVDKEGNPKEVQALTMKGSKLAEVAVNAIRKGPKWVPAMQYGRLVNAYREQPVTFTISSR